MSRNLRKGLRARVRPHTMCLLLLSLSLPTVQLMARPASWLLAPTALAGETKKEGEVVVLGQMLMLLDLPLAKGSDRRCSVEDMAQEESIGGVGQQGRFATGSNVQEMQLVTFADRCHAFSAPFSAAMCSRPSMAVSPGEC